MKTRLMRIENVSLCLIVKRLNRFAVEIMVQKKPESAHINNSGRLTECIIKDREAYCLGNLKNTDKTKYRLFAIRENNSSILIDTRMQTLSFELAVEKGLLPWMNSCRIKG